ncbi:MAG: hypothetical protein KGM44_05600 [bacterium]|nr:hypothetical protein [bacterium]
MSTQSQSERAISGANALGSPVKSYTNYEQSISAPASGARRTQSLALGQCNNGFEFFAPDKNGDPNSTEAEFFYDQTCTEPARDAVRIYNRTSSSSETVNRTETLYALNNSTPIATSVRTNTITNATFDTYGFAVVASGFDRVGTGYLNVSGSRTIDSDGEIVMQPASGNVSRFCGDSAGFNATGFQRLGETFGWQGGDLSGGTRTVNGDGSVTWASTRSGFAVKGAIGSLSIATGTQNTSCPISTPMFTIAGGTQLGSYNVPVSVTYRQGMLTNLTVTNGTLSNGDTLNVTTSSSQPPTSQQFISGVLSNGGTQIATFNVDAFGNGTVTISSSGAQFVMTDWHVVR